MPITSHVPGSAAQKVAPAQGQVGSHLQASQMAHAAAQRAAVAKVLSKGSGAAPVSQLGGVPKPGSFKAHVLKVAGFPKGSVQVVHQAIQTGVQQGSFTQDQGDALTAHDGPLVGPKGAQTIATLGSIASKMKGP